MSTPFRVTDFSGGMDDNYLSSNPNCAYLLSNFWLDINAKPHCRPGTTVFTNQLTTSSGHTQYSGMYLGEKPFGRPICIQGTHAFYIDQNDAIQEILGPSSNPALPGKTDTTLEAANFYQKQLIMAAGAATRPARIYCSSFTDGSPFTATYKTLTLGLPGLASTPTCTGSAGSNNYLYAFHYYYTFTDFQGTTFEEKGDVVQVTVNSIAQPSSNSVSITNIPVLSNSSSTNYDTSNIKVYIYRTQNNGQTFNLIGNVTNGTTTFTDNFSDAAIIANQELYTDGGILQYDQPPNGALYSTVVNDFTWYATDAFVTHSVQGAPGAAPSSYYYYTEQKICGLGKVIGYPILLCDRAIYRVEGNYDEFGNNGFDLREIHPTAGCKSNRSVVAIPGGIVWAGNGGFYFTDGYKVTRISTQFFKRYPIWVSQSDVSGTYDPDRNLVFWTVHSAVSSTYPDTLLVLHLNFGLTERSVFTVWQSSNFSVVTAAYSDSFDVDSRFRSLLMGIDILGYLLTFTDSSYVDYYLNTNAAVSTFLTAAIIYDYQSVAMDFGDDTKRKYCTELTCEMATETNSAVQFFTRRDDGGTWKPLSEVRSDYIGGPGAIIWNTSEYAWNNTTVDQWNHDWDSLDVTEGKRQLPSGILRSNRRQIRVTNSMTAIYRSDDFCLADTSIGGTTGTQKLVTLENSAFSWATDINDYFISFDSDLYTQQFQIQSVISTTQISVYDPTNAFTALTGRKWQIKGYRKNDRPHILSYTIWFDETGEVTQKPYQGSAGLVNA